jgi:predicted Abi (CAAX) family protease
MPQKVRNWRTRKDPFEAVWPQISQWLENEPDQTAKTLLERLQRDCPDEFSDGQLRTLQRRVKAWRRNMANRLIFGIDGGQSDMESDSIATKDHNSANPSFGNILDEAAR